MNLLKGQGYRRQPDNAKVIQQLVAAYGKQGQWSEALSLSDKLIEEPRTQSLGYYLKGRVYYDKKEYALAITAFETILADKPAAIEFLQFLMRAHQREDQLDLAYAYLQKHITDYPEHAHALELMGNLHQEQGAVAKAISFYKKTIDIAPTRSSAYRFLAALHASESEWEKAVAVFDQGLSHNPSDLGLLMSLAVLQSRREAFDEAIVAYERILILNPDHAMAANNLAVLLADHRPTPENLERARTLDWMYYNMGNTSQALTLLAESVESGGNSGVYHYHLGMAYHSSNQHSLAKQQLQLALENEKESYVGREEAEATLKLLK
ncbi:MAG: tetratricopeptide repeat protein [Pseudomonadales bacterium]|nr:tetratricopeptide repeat protein [Pseudomonadales bacterium]